jgi:hypothetical protein
MAHSSSRVEILSKHEMERKHAEAEDYIKTCKRFPIKSSPNRIVVHKRERGFRYDDLDGNTIAIIYFYVGPDDVEYRRIRLLVIDGITYVPEAMELPHG